MLNLPVVLKSKIIIISIFVSLVFLTDSRAQKTIGEISLPDTNFKRIKVNDSSFAAWLRNQKIKPKGSAVLDYKGREYKSGSDTTIAFVLDIDIRNRRTEQCMDILIRLYSEYSWQTGNKDHLVFPLPGGHLLYWQEWQTGWRPKFKGIHVSMQKSAKPDSSFSNFESYLRTIYAESHTQQFYHGYLPIKRSELQIGDFIVKKGSKAHAAMIADLAEDEQGNLQMLIGHGDTPACQFYLLSYKKNQPWFPVDFSEDILPLPIRRKMSWTGLRRFSEMK